ncbi:hypothetical protein R6Q59_008233 [Mikania micrantha]|uniref:BHLH domain-containing protein n=1 Tax=Mikania micrantha TaxID=192012 RepID=A0A5N6Q4J2_9ASTR|nr:hypothetical protein E3N88_02539 [Mikania micrantha]
MEPMNMNMELDDLPEQLSFPFQHLSDPPLIQFSGGSSANNNHQTPPVIYRYPPAPLIMQTQQLRTSWFQQKPESTEAMREMIFQMAALQPVRIDPESIKPPKRRNVKISKDPQSVAARHRRERISERIRILQRLVPGGTKMDTASMLDEAAHYMKFLKNQVQYLEQAAAAPPGFNITGTGTMNHGQYSHHVVRACGQPAANQAYSHHMVGSLLN